MKKQACILIAAALFLTGCQNAPDSEIVIHKEMDKIIEEASNQESKLNIGEVRSNTAEHYETDLFSPSLNIAANVSADVQIPEVNTVSIYRVKQHQFTQAEVDKVRALLFGDEELIDMVENQKKTRSEIEEEIAGLREMMTRETQERQNVYQQRIDMLQAEFETASDKPLEIPSDGKLRNVATENEQNPGEFWTYMNGYDPDGEVLYVANKAQNAGMYVQNSANFSNKIEFSASPVGTQVEADPFVHSLYSLEFERPHYFANEMRVIPENFVYRAHNFDENLKQVEGDSCTLSQEDADAKAREMLHEIGADSFAFYEGGLHTELLVKMDGQLPSYFYRTCYILRYCRTIGGMMIRQDSGMKAGETESNKIQLWPEEVIEFTIDDHGIVGFRWCAPLEITETIVENASLKPFDEIRSTFEKFILYTNACLHEENGTSTPVRLKIDNISFSYSRISERDSFETGLIIPVWGFSGKKSELTNDNVLKEQAEITGQQTFEYEMVGKTGALLAINAIDGSVIDPALGY